MRHPSRATLFGVSRRRRVPAPARPRRPAGGWALLRPRCARGDLPPEPDDAGGFSIYYEDVEFAGAPPVDVLTKSSGLFAEAAESVTKCGAICEVRTADCGAFTFSRDARFGNASCSLFAVPGDKVARTAAGPLRVTSGIPPKTRRTTESALVVAAPRVVELAKENRPVRFQGTFTLRLGSQPIRGGVRIRVGCCVPARRQGRSGEPYVPVWRGITFDPEDVALYDNDTSVLVTVTAGDDPTWGARPVPFSVTSCDPAFTSNGPLGMLLDVVQPLPTGGWRGTPSKKRHLVIVVICIAVLVGTLLVVSAAIVLDRSNKKKRELEVARAVLVQEQVEAARERVREFQAHFCVLPGDKFVGLQKIPYHEDVRDALMIYDRQAEVLQEINAGSPFVFLSHQWLAYDDPDPDGVHVAAMRSAVESVSKHAGVPLERVRVWLDVVSIPQKNTGEQKLAMASLPTFAAVCNYFVVVAPETVHADTDCKCDADSYRRRAWCRAEVMSCWARNGTGDMYLSTNQTLEPLAPSNDVLAESLDVFSGELTCCSLGHPNGCLCDREHLMLPMLGMYGMVYRDRHGVARDAYAVLEPIREKLFPKTFVYSRFVEDGVRGDGDCGNEKIETTEPLFGDLVEAVERDIDLASAQSDDPILRARPPDYVPGTNAQRRAGLRRTRKLHAENSLRSLDKSLRALDKLRSSFLK